MVGFNDLSEQDRREVAAALALSASISEALEGDSPKTRRRRLLALVVLGDLAFEELSDRGA